MLTCRCLNIKIHAHRPARDSAAGSGVANGGKAVAASSDEEDPSSRRGSRTPVRLGVGGLTVEQPALLAIAREPDREPASVSLRCLNCAFTACSFALRPGTGFPETTRDLVRRPVPTTLAPLDDLVHVAQGALTAEEVELAKASAEYSQPFRLVLKGSSLTAETDDDSIPKVLRPEYSQARRSIASALSTFLAADARTTEEDIARYREKMLADLQQRQRVAARQQRFLWKKICDAHAGDVYEHSNAKESSRVEATAENGELASPAGGAAGLPAQRFQAVDNEAVTPPPARPNAELARHHAASTTIRLDVRDKRPSHGLPEERELVLGTGSDHIQLDVQHDRENGRIARSREAEGKGNIDDDNDSEGTEGSEAEDESNSDDDVPRQSAGSGGMGARHEFARYGRSAPINIVFPQRKPGDARSPTAGSARIQMSLRKQPARSGPVSGRRRLSDSPAARRRAESGESRASSPTLPEADFEAVSAGPPPDRPGDRPRNRPAATSPFVAPHILAEQEEEEMKNSLFLGSVPRNARSHY